MDDEMPSTCLDIVPFVPQLALQQCPAGPTAGKVQPSKRSNSKRPSPSPSPPNKCRRLEERDAGESPAEGKPAEVMVVCYHCDEPTPITKTTSAGGNTASRICHDCRSAEKALRGHYYNQGKIQEWKTMEKSKRKSMIKNNKHNKSKKGKARQVTIVETSSVRAYSQFPGMFFKVPSN